MFAWRLIRKALRYVIQGLVPVPVEAPSSTGRASWDPLVVAVVGEAAERLGVDQPDWTSDLIALDSPFSFAENELILEWTRARTPAYLAALNIWLEDGALAAA